MAVRNFRVNRQIRIPQVRLIDQNGDPVTVAGSAVLLVYNPQPLPGPPSPLAEAPPSP